MPCQKVTAKKYIERPSPAFHATECKNEIKKGNDGKTYKSTPDKRGVYTWKLVKSSDTRKKGRSIKYTTVNNGNSYWIVEDFPKSKRALIYRNNPSQEKVMEVPYAALWTGSPLLAGDKRFADGAEKKGNTVLIQKNQTTFLIVYNQIYEFSIQPGDKPLKFVSPIGNNDSPYPYLVCKNNIYFIFDDGKSFEYVAKEDIDLNEDVISQYLHINEFKNAKVISKNLLKTKMIHNF